MKPLDPFAFPFHARINIDVLLRFTRRHWIISVQQLAIFIFVFAQFIADARRQLIDRHRFFHDSAQWLPDRVTQDHVLIQREHPQAVFSDVHQAVATDDKVHQCFMHHHPVIAGFNAAQNRQLQLVQRQLDFRFI